MIINNSEQRATEPVPPSINEETNNDGVIPVSLDGNETQIADTASSLAGTTTTHQAPLGRTFNDNGRLVSTRLKKSTQSEEFNY